MTSVRAVRALRVGLPMPRLADDILQFVLNISWFVINMTTLFVMIFRLQRFLGYKQIPKYWTAWKLFYTRLQHNETNVQFLSAPFSHSICLTTISNLENDRLIKWYQSQIDLCGVPEIFIIRTLYCHAFFYFFSRTRDSIILFTIF